jgi:hypothetical protein
MALIQVRVFEAWIETTGDDPGPAETFVGTVAVAAPASVDVDLEAVNPFGGEIRADVVAPASLVVDLEAVNPSGGTIAADILAPAGIDVDLEAVIV